MKILESAFLRLAQEQKGVQQRSQKIVEKYEKRQQNFKTESFNNTLVLGEGR